MDKSQVDALVEAYRAGTSVAILTRRFRLHKDTVYEHLQRAGIRTDRVNKLGPADVARAAELYGYGLSLKIVGERLDVDARTVREALVKAGVPIRPRRGWSPSK